MSKARHVQPQCLALVLCDSVIEDARTRNKSLINMFNGLLTPQVPVRQERLVAFAAFTGGRGSVPIALRLCFDKEYERDLLRLPAEVEFPRDLPHAVVDLVFEIRGFVFPSYGNYTFEVRCEEVPVLMRRFTVAQPPAPSPAGQGPLPGGFNPGGFNPPSGFPPPPPGGPSDLA